MSYNLFVGSGVVDWMQNDGTAVVNTETAFNAGTVRNGGNVSASGPLDAISVVTTYDESYGGGEVAGINNAVGPALWVASSTTGVVSVTDSPSPWAGSIEVNSDLSHGLVQGDSVRLTDSVSGLYGGVYRVVNVTDANAYTVNGEYTNTVATGLSIDHAQVTVDGGSTKKTVGYLSAGRYATRGVALSIYNGSSTVNVMSTPASEYGRRKLHSKTAVRSFGVAAAIRAGYWDIYSGTFSTAPTAANDFAAMGADAEISGIGDNVSVGGEFAFQYGIVTTTGNYDGLY